ncbi:diacylglycerol kinase family protein [Streptomyces sp. ACA25]|uniref:diacylglycerol kinase family protein n=1 Tax=Streptomyces sp. ACA25 TaxID=3022596 RepID=UPI002307A4AF|nr:diacylglycerol kinase family protein [Streptomyces sp. ACA25]MDB1086024.1 diacylglycerol kinase family protein [Streptomyces sp. ACA25]
MDRGAGGEQVLIVIDPIARHADGESVRIARDVLCAAVAGAKVCVLDRPQAMLHALTQRGSRRVVIIGGDRALLRAVRMLYLSGELDEHPLGVVPVGPEAAVAVIRSLGVPADAVLASRAVLSGPARPIDLLVDDAGGVVLGALGIPAPQPGPEPPGTRPWWRPARSTEAGSGALPAQRLRVEADGEVLTDGAQPGVQVSVTADGGLAAVEVRHSAGAAAVTARVSSVTVTGPGFSYRADTVNCGPARSRTWQVRPAALRLTVPVG